MAYDALLVLKAQATETASANGASVDLKTGTPRRGLSARVLVTAVSGTSPSMNVVLQHSSDNVTFTTFAQSDPITAVGEYFIPFASDVRYMRVISTISGTSPSFTYVVDASTARP